MFFVAVSFFESENTKDTSSRRSTHDVAHSLFEPADLYY